MGKVGVGTAERGGRGQGGESEGDRGRREGVVGKGE